jgi:GT2 family glycosyltransferase
VKYQKYLSIVIVHFNTPQETIKCIESILKVLTAADLYTYEILVIDNRSNKNNYLSLKNYFPQESYTSVKIIRNNMNSGFGLGCMMAMNFSNGKYTAFVNSDTFFEEDCFSDLIAFLEKTPDAGMVTPQQRNMSGNLMPTFRRFDSFAQRFGGKLVHKIFYKGEGADPCDHYSHPVAVDFIMGSFMLVNTYDFFCAGGFDPNIFLYYEEMDLCLRLKKNGKKTYFYPYKYYKHIGGASAPNSKSLRLESQISMLYVIRKHHSYFYFILFKSALLIQLFLKSPFKARNRWLLWRLITLGVPQTQSLRTFQFVEKVCSDD